MNWTDRPSSGNSGERRKRAWRLGGGGASQSIVHDLGPSSWGNKRQKRVEARQDVHIGNGWGVGSCMIGSWGLRLEHSPHHRSHCEVTTRIGGIESQTKEAFLLELYGVLY